MHERTGILGITDQIDRPDVTDLPACKKERE